MIKRKLWGIEFIYDGKVQHCITHLDAIKAVLKHEMSIKQWISLWIRGDL